MLILFTGIKRHIGLLFIALLCVAATGSLADVAIPPLKSHITDLTGTLTKTETIQLEQQLANFEEKKGSQIAVLIVPSTQPETIEQYSIRVVEAWKLGRKGIDDGVLLLVAKNDRTLRIETGYGLEGALPDAIARRIIDEGITPKLKHGNFFGGLQTGIRQIISVIEGEPLPVPAQQSIESAGTNLVLENIIPVLFVMLMLGRMLQATFGKMTGATIASSIAGLLIWLISSSLLIAVLVAIAAFVISLFEKKGRIIHQGGSRNGRRNWPGGGGFSSGGFRGGGGGFGGGGASGRW
ncbi:MAG TPA: YgcG family protein [Nitrosomonas mobilis]|nr:YgcG family protein [Nitrosomonas mobilis]